MPPASLYKFESDCRRQMKCTRHRDSTSINALAKCMEAAADNALLKDARKLDVMKFGNSII